MRLFSGLAGQLADALAPGRSKDLFDSDLLHLRYLLAEEKSVRTSFPDVSLPDEVFAVWGRFVVAAVRAELHSERAREKVDEVAVLMLSHPDLPLPVVERVLLALLDELRRANKNRSSRGWPQQLSVTLRTALLDLLAHPGVSVSLVGTAWRLMHWIGMRSMQTRYLIWSPACPPTVVARMLLDRRHAQPLVAEPFMLARLGEMFPDLDGLPRDMLLEVVASQDIPADWFFDAVEVPDDVSMTAPGIPATRHG